MSTRTTPKNCYVHTKTPAATQCTGCGRHICIDCEEFEGGGVRCGPCANKARGRRMLRNLAIATVALVAMVALVLLVSGSPETKTPHHDKTPIGDRIKAEDTPKRAFDYGDHAPKVARFEREIAQKPCARGLAVRFGETLNTAGDYEGALLMAKQWLAKCGEFKRLLWVVSYAHEGLKEWAKAAAIDTQLIEHDPRDNDFWWWRGKNYLQLKRNLEAAADFRQSIANQNLQDSSGIAVMKLATVSKQLNQPCVGAFALQLFSDAKSGEMNRRAKHLHGDLHLAGNCNAIGGTGNATIRLDTKSPVTKLRLTLNGAPATFMVDIRSGYTVVSRRLAKKLSIAASDAPELHIFAAGKMRKGSLTQLASIRAKGARATQVHAVIADLPAGIDGVLGLSFFWRFEVTEADNSYQISARK